MTRTAFVAAIALLAAIVSGAPATHAQEGPDLLFRKSTDFKLLTPNDKLATYSVDDPLVTGVACYYTVHEKGEGSPHVRRGSFRCGRKKYSSHHSFKRG